MPLSDIQNNKMARINDDHNAGGSDYSPSSKVQPYTAIPKGSSFQPTTRAPPQSPPSIFRSPQGQSNALFKGSPATSNATGGPGPAMKRVVPPTASSANPSGIQRPVSPPMNRPSPTANQNISSPGPVRRNMPPNTSSANPNGIQRPVSPPMNRPSPAANQNISPGPVRRNMPPNTSSANPNGIQRPVSPPMNAKSTSPPPMRPGQSRVGGQSNVAGNNAPRPSNSPSVRPNSPPQNGQPNSRFANPGNQGPRTNSPSARRPGFN
jgi:hypothetical protein